MKCNGKDLRRPLPQYWTIAATDTNYSSLLNPLSSLGTRDEAGGVTATLRCVCLGRFA